MMPVLFQIGPVRIYSMGVALAVGMLASLYWWWKMGRDEHWEEISLFDGYFLAVIATVVVGRAGYVIANPGEIGGFWQAWSILARPGIVWAAGLAAGVGVVTLLSRAKEWELWKVWDALAVALSLAVWWGMVGILLNEGELVRNGWGVVWAGVAFGVTSVVRKNFRFYSWYRGESSVAKDGLVALVGAGMVAIYYLGLAVIASNWWLLAAAGVGIVVVLGLIYRRSGRSIVQWHRKVRRR